MSVNAAPSSALSATGQVRTITARWKGIRPIIQHSERLADPTNEFAKAIKLITDKGSKKMTEEDHERRNHLEWEGGLYWDDKLGPVIPGDNIEACIKEGAQKSRLGKDVVAAVWTTSSVWKLEYDGPRTKAALYKSAAIFVNRKGVVVGQSRIMRCRPMFPTGWTLQFTLEYDPTVINGKSIVKAMCDAGALVGLGDWRPKFGRFTVEVLSGGEDDGETTPAAEPEPAE